MRIQLSWTDPKNGQANQPISALPIAIGRSFGLMPGTLNGQAVSRIVLNEDPVDIYHALLEEQNGAVMLSAKSDSPLRVNGYRVESTRLKEGDLIQIGSFELTFRQAKDDVLPPAVPLVMPPPPPIPGTSSGASAAQGPPDLPTASAAGQATSTDDFGNLAAGLSSPSSANVMQSGTWKCDRKVGFLFKRNCDRTSTQGCPHCGSGQASQDAYFYDYDLYPGYGSYGRGSWGYGYYSNRDRYSYNRDTRNVDFTEGDASSFENEYDTDYEMDYGDS